jgi:hypothetical protein
MPGSMAGKPLPARAAAARRIWEREKSRQQSDISAVIDVPGAPLSPARAARTGA